MRRIIIEREFGGHRVPVGTEGFFHCWGSESNEGAGPDTVAVIEKDDGAVIYAYPGQIRFLEPFATTAKLAATPAGIARACGLENEVEAAQEVSATNPPKGFELVKVDDLIKPGALCWVFAQGPWSPMSWPKGMRMAVNYHSVANPIEVAP